MKKNQLITYIFIIFPLLLGSSFFLFQNSIFAASDATVEATIKISVCGNGIKEGSEQCDGSDLAGQSCTTEGYTGGTLSCSASCTFNTSACTTAAPAPASGGGGGGGGGYIAPAETAAVFSGRAYPKSTVTLLKDAQIAATAVAGSDASFLMKLSGLSGGNYIFAVYSEDSKGIRSSLLTFPVSVTSGATSYVSAIFLAPTIVVDKSEVKRGDNIAIFGQSAPQADIIISVNSEEEFFGKTISDKDGVYLYNFDTSIIDYGTHNTKSKASIGNQLVSSWSYLVGFRVGTKNIMAELPKVVTKGDLNSDRRVNLIDFSIAAYWYKRSSPLASADLNGDGKVDLIDFSIMAFYWTG